MTVLFVNRYFHPDQSATSQMLSDLAFGLAETGRPVTVVTSRSRYNSADGPLPATEVVNGVRVHRIWTTRFGRGGLAGRAIDYLTFYLACTWALFRLARRGDVIVAKTDPPMISIPAAMVAAVRGARLVNWLQDVFPEVAQALSFGRGRPSRAAMGIMKALRDWSLRRATRNVVLGQRMQEYVRGLGIPPDRIEVIPNWADGAVLRPVDAAANSLKSAWGLADRFVVGYSGNLGRAHDYSTILDAIRLVEHRARTQHAAGAAEKVRWLFIGSGALVGEFQHRIAAQRLTTVVFKPYQPKEALAESLSVADVHLVSLQPQLEGLIVPSKIYGIAAVARPSVFIGDADGEVARLLRRWDAGYVIRQGDGAELAELIVSLATDPSPLDGQGANARRVFEAEMDKPRAVAAWIELLDDVARGTLGQQRQSQPDHGA